MEISCSWFWQVSRSHTEIKDWKQLTDTEVAVWKPAYGSSTKTIPQHAASPELKNRKKKINSSIWTCKSPSDSRETLLLWQNTKN